MSEMPNKLRLELDANASNAANEMIRSLKVLNGSLSVNYSKLCSAIVARYLASGCFEKDRSLLERQFFNERKFLREALRKGEDIREVIKKLPTQKKEKTVDSRAPVGGSAAA